MPRVLATPQPTLANRSPSAHATAQNSPRALPSHLAARLGAARPRLVRLARAEGFAPEVADDIAQETLLEAWRHCETVREDAGLDAWLNTICRHVYHRFWRARGLANQRFVSLDTEPPGDDVHGGPSGAILTSGLVAPDPDPAEWLERQDLETLLDRALGFLAPAARELVEQCYLREKPQREVAVRLGLSISALEARLHRARRQLRAVLAGELRAEASAFGLTFTAEHEPGWRESRIWCPTCGHHRLRGAFEPLPRDGINLHLECPGCGYQVNSGGVVPLDGLTAFRPAYKRLLAYAAPYVTQGIMAGQQTCLLCGAMRPMRLDGLGEHAEGSYQWPGLTAVLECPTCAVAPNTLAALLVWQRPEVQRFQQRHPRCINEPEARVEYQGQPALHIRLTDILSAARLTLFVHAQTLDVLALFEA